MLTKLIDHEDRNLVKSIVPAANPQEIQEAMDSGIFKRKNRKAEEIVDGNYTMLFTASADTLDRDSERVLPNSFQKDMEYYNENPVVLYGHDYQMPAVGKCVESGLSGNSFKMKVQFAVEENPMAAVLWGLYSKRFMRMVSVGFIPIQWTDDKDMKFEGQEGLTFIRNELIELSFVNIGSNRHALSELPVEIKGDPVLRDAYSNMIESGNKSVNSKSSSSKSFDALSGMFPESYEERQRAIHEDLMDYLEHELDAIDKHEYVEAYPIATYADHVIVYCWNTDKIYKANYVMGDGEVEFTDLKQIQLNYEEIPMGAKALLKSSNIQLSTF